MPEEPLNSVALHSHSTSELLTSVASPNSTRKRARRKSSPKRVRLDCQVFLKHTWSMWFDQGSTFDMEEKSKLGTFNTIQVCLHVYIFSITSNQITKGFWRYYNQIVDLASFPKNSNLSIFKENPTLPGTLPKKTCKWVCCKFTI